MFDVWSMVYGYLPLVIIRNVKAPGERHVTCSQLDPKMLILTFDDVFITMKSGMSIMSTVSFSP